jgi:hypothetical protein
MPNELEAVLRVRLFSTTPTIGNSLPSFQVLAYTLHINLLAAAEGYSEVFLSFF